MAEDPLFKFLKSVSEKIKVEKEHRDLMEKIEDVVVEPKNDPLQSAIDILKLKLAEKIEPKSAEIPTTPEISIALDTESNNKVEMAQEKDNFSDFLINLKNILAGKEIDKSKEIIKVQEQKDDKPAENVAEDKPQQSSIKTSVEEPSKEEKEKNTYVDILDQLSNEPISSREPEKVNEIRALIEQYAEKYFKKAAIMSEYAGGGGTDAVQYANGGTMNGDLNVNGNILSGGNNLLDLFSGGGGGGDPAVNALVHSNSGYWNTAYTNLVANSAAYLLQPDISLIASASGNWNSVYTTVQTESASWGGGDAPGITLPVPKVVLFAYTSSVAYLSGRNSNQYDENTLGYAGSIFLSKKPHLVVNDFTQDIFDNYVICIEMVMFKHKKKYSVPVGSVTPPWGDTFWTRCGMDSAGYPQDSAPRYNHLSITNNGQYVDLSPCLNGRFKLLSTPYLDSSSVSNSDFRYINTIVPFSKTNRSSGSNIRRFGYKQYKPMYVAFRYVAYLSSANAGRGQIISGPLSPTIRIVNSIWPFNTNHSQSNVKGFQVVNLNTNFNKEAFKCEFV